MKLFRNDNTEGYSDFQLDTLNLEWSLIVARDGLEEYTEAYDIAASDFADEVNGR